LFNFTVGNFGHDVFGISRHLDRATGKLERFHPRCAKKEKQMNEEERKEFAKLCEPLMEWMADNCHPHYTAIINYTRADLVEGVVGHRTEKFIRD